MALTGPSISPYCLVLACCTPRVADRPSPMLARRLGYLLCFGVFLEDLEQRLDQTAATLNFIQGLTNLGSNAVSFWVGRLGDRYGYKKCIGAGCVLSVLSLVGAALSYESLPALFVTQGVLLGVSQGLGMSLFMALPSQWFLERRGLATGISMSGSGIGGGAHLALACHRCTLTMTSIPRRSHRVPDPPQHNQAGLPERCLRSSCPCLLLWSCLTSMRADLHGGQRRRLSGRLSPDRGASSSAQAGRAQGAEALAAERRVEGRALLLSHGERVSGSLWLPRELPVSPDVPQERGGRNRVDLPNPRWPGQPPFYFITALTKQQCPEYDPDSLVVAAPLIVGSAVCGIGRVRAFFGLSRCA